MDTHGNSCAWPRGRAAKRSPAGLLLVLLLALQPAWARVNTDKPLAADEG